MDSVEKIFLVWSKSSGSYRRLEALLKDDNWCVKVTSTLEDYTSFETNTSQGNKIVCLAIFQPVCKFSKREIEEIHKFYTSRRANVLCNCLLIAHGSCSDKESETNDKININDIVSQFGIEFKTKIEIIRPNAYKFYNPNEAQLMDFIANRTLGDLMKKYNNSSSEMNQSEDLKSFHEEIVQAKIIFARGCSLNVDTKQSTILMSSSPWALPSNQAICALNENYNNISAKRTLSSSGEQANRLIAISSSQIFTDKYLDKENNKSLIKSLLEALIDKEFSINVSDARTIEIPESNLSGNLLNLCDKPIACLQESFQLPANGTVRELFNLRLFSFDNLHLPKVLRAYKDLHLYDTTLSCEASNNQDAQKLPSSKQLQLIKPQLDLPNFIPIDRTFLIRIEQSLIGEKKEDEQSCSGSGSSE